MKLLERVSVMVSIAGRKRNRPGRLGKTSMLKLLYLLQEVYGVPLGYRFSLYTYGPYDSSVMGDIDYADATNLLSVCYEGRDRGYQIEPGNAPGAPDLPSAVEAHLGDLLDVFGDMTARDLELRSTLVLVAKDLNRKDRAKVIDLVADVKPKFSKHEIESAFDELNERGLLDRALSRGSSVDS